MHNVVINMVIRIASGPGGNRTTLILYRAMQCLIAVLTYPENTVGDFGFSITTSACK